MDGELIVAIIFYSILGLLIYHYRNRFTKMYKFVYVYKTKLGIPLMKKLARFSLIWKIYSTIAIPVAIYFGIWIGKMLLENAIQIFQGTAMAGVTVAIPGIKIPGSPISIPLFQGLLAIIILAIVHEFSHGVIAAMEGLRIKSTGFGFFFIIPLAFVELDEEKMRKLPKLSQMRIAASGAFANILLWLLLSVFISFAISPSLEKITIYDGINITGITKGMPAENAGIPVGSVIYGINGKETKNLISFGEELHKHKPGSTVILNTNKGNFSVALTKNPKNPELPYIGVTLQQLSHISESVREKYGLLVDVFLWIAGALFWLATLNLLIGVMNFLPIFGLDGGIIFYNLFGYFIKDEKILAKILSLIFSFYLALLIFNIVGPFFF